jgi:predicted transposase/invertase (TIGR01784 family)
MPFASDRYIVEIEYLTPELVPDNPGKKFSVVDVRCTDNFKRKFIVEMQTRWYASFMKRIVFNACKTYIRQLDRSEEYHLLQPVYTICILNQNFDHHTSEFYHHFQIINRENSDETIPGLEFILVELTEKFRPETMSDRKLMVLWLRFLKEVNENMKSLPVEMQENEPKRQAAQLCEEGAFTPAELAAYDGFWDAIRTEKTALRSERETGLAQGEAIGVEKGLAQGEAIGVEKGLAQGEAEREKLKAELNAMAARMAELEKTANSKKQ